MKTTDVLAVLARGPASTVEIYVELAKTFQTTPQAVKAELVALERRGEIRFRQDKSRGFVYYVFGILQRGA